MRGKVLLLKPNCERSPKLPQNGHVHVQLGRPDHNHHQVGQNISQIKENVQHRTGVATPHTLRENEEHVGVDAVAK